MPQAVVVQREPKVRPATVANMRNRCIVEVPVVNGVRGLGTSRSCAYSRCDITDARIVPISLHWYSFLHEPIVGSHQLLVFNKQAFLNSLLSYGDTI